MKKKNKKILEEKYRILIRKTLSKIHNFADSPPECQPDSPPNSPTDSTVPENESKVVWVAEDMSGDILGEFENEESAIKCWCDRYNAYDTSFSRFGRFGKSSPKKEIAKPFVYSKIINK